MGTWYNKQSEMVVAGGQHIPLLISVWEQPHKLLYRKENKIGL